MSKFIKYAILAVTLFLGIILLIGAITRKEVIVEKEIIINKSKSEVFNYIKLLKNQDNYAIWKFRTPEMKTIFKGTDGTKGFIAQWEDPQSAGEQEIINIEEGNKIEYQLRFTKPNRSDSEIYLKTESINPLTTKVIWGFKKKMPFPVNIMLLFMNLEESIGKDFEGGLKNLKKILEKEPSKDENTSA